MDGSGVKGGIWGVGGAGGRGIDSVFYKVYLI